MRFCTGVGFTESAPIFPRHNSSGEGAIHGAPVLGNCQVPAASFCHNRVGLLKCEILIMSGRK